MGIVSPLGKNRMDCERVAKFIKQSASAQHVDECWRDLKSHLVAFGFNRILFASKVGASKGNLHNLFGTFILSSYGDAIDNLFITNRGFVEDFTVNWLLENNGAISWQVNRDRYLQNEMTQEEERVHLLTRDLGLTSGYSYTSTPRDAGFAAGFGLCAAEWIEQPEVDKTWLDHGETISSLLDVFLLTARRMPMATPEQTLPAATLETLRHIFEGRTNSEIAELMGCHRRTVEHRLSKARAKLQATNTSQLVAIAVAQGQLS